jgi:uncharacterized protein YndB with AHSA1/START domain
MTPKDSAVVVVQRLLPARPEVVYDEWLDPEALSEWMCPRPARATRIELDPRAGGRLRIDIEESGAAFFVTGRFLTLDRPHRLAFTWTCSTWPDPNLDTTVMVTLEPSGAGDTRMTIRHEALLPDLRADHLQGWAAIAQQLDQRLRVRPTRRTPSCGSGAGGPQPRAAELGG